MNYSAESIKEEYNNTIEKAYSLLDLNNEWEDRYKDYISTINDSYFPTQCKMVKDMVHITWPFAAYLNVSSVINSGMSLDLRLFGTSVATLYVKYDSLTKDERNLIRDGKIDALDVKRINSLVRISFKDKENAFKELIGESSRTKSQTIKSEFICEEYWDKSFIDELITGVDFDWHDKKIDRFRSIVKRIYDKDGFEAGKEHAHESNVLRLMKCNKKYFNAMQPVMLEGSFFQMPTPFKGSNSKDDEIAYAGSKGGGIDILARKKLGSKNELCVIEIKDHYERGEEPIKAIKQAIAYSAFMVKLIQSESGEKWYKYFGMNSTTENININAVVAMPYKTNKDGLSEEDVLFDNMVLDAGNGCTITLHYIYYDEKIFYSKEYDPNGIIISVKRDKEK